MTPPALEIEALLKSFSSPDGGRHLVVDVPSFKLAAGAHLALAGGSGSGKTTFLHLIAGLLRPDSGSVRIAGEPASSLAEGERDLLRARRIGYVFQTFHLLQGLTALENVELGMAFGSGIDADRAAALLRRVGLGDRLGHRPAQLSTGQQQRVAVARALAGKPSLVLADEPTGNLDHRLTKEIISLIREVCRENQAALLVVSHDREVLAGFETVVELASINRAAAVNA
jgi:putative ABC transport system ATP-binding protein